MSTSGCAGVDRLGERGELRVVHVLAREQRERLGAVCEQQRRQRQRHRVDVVADDFDLVLRDADDLTRLDVADLALRILDRGRDLTGAHLLAASVIAAAISSRSSVDPS